MSLAHTMTIRKPAVLPETLGSRPYRLGLRLAEALEDALHDLDTAERETLMEGFRGYLVPRCNPGCQRCAERPTKWYQADALLRQILGLLDPLKERQL